MDPRLERAAADLAHALTVRWLNDRNWQSGYRPVIDRVRYMAPTQVWEFVCPELEVPYIRIGTAAPPGSVTELIYLAEHALRGFYRRLRERAVCVADADEEQAQISRLLLDLHRDHYQAGVPARPRNVGRDDQGDAFAYSIAATTPRLRPMTLGSPDYNQLVRWWREVGRDRETITIVNSAAPRGMALFTSYLTERQRQSHEANGFIVVVGNDSGLPYLIHTRGSASFNIHTITKVGKRRRTTTLCIQPEGDLCHGDIFLSQKMALETREKAALEVANNDVYPRYTVAELQRIFKAATR